MLQQILGVDVASEELVAYKEDSLWKKMANEKTCVLALLKELPKDTIIALEATGGYGHLLAELAHKQGFVVYMLQPGKVKNYCKSSPSRGKSDKNDARDIASYVAAFHSRLHPWSPLPQFETQLRKLYRKREGIADHLASLRKQLRSLGDTPAQVSKTLQKLAERVDELTEEIEKMLATDPDSRLLAKIPAVKTNLIAASLPVLRVIPFKDKYALDSYAGIDLKMNESGKFKGKRRMSHEGDSHLRRAVYMAGLCGTTCKVWRPYYERLINDKKLPKVAAINALGRKILHTVFGVYHTKTEFIAPEWT